MSSDNIFYFHLENTVADCLSGVDFSLLSSTVVIFGPFLLVILCSNVYIFCSLVKIQKKRDLMDEKQCVSKCTYNKRFT